MQNKLTFITETDEEGNALSYYLTGDILDDDDGVFPVGEFTFSWIKAWETLMHYTQNFKNVTVTFETKEQ